ncbi:Cobalt transport protein CbiM [Methanimicrococcus hongohii]|uniref:Cobalt transport protein CbiM n=1 Tax=Methanimicrococcus hongohii TaxID=3028295 RepID=A0AA96ZSC5_9EURY|nr:CbiM family transporter [Methanimicrococcus sp. Hf6]WNY23269.1 Cobalt transport protein CbiM [Methanimicrococcus sp. Hf6]
MHISEGVLPAWMLAVGWVLTIISMIICIQWSQKKFGNIFDKVPAIAVITAAFFVACLFRVPVPPTSLHLILSGLVGILLGPLAFVCIFVGLLLQALLFQNGGITVLGVNTFVMGAPAVLAWIVFNYLTKKTNTAVSAGIASALSIFISSILLAIVLVASGVTFGSLTVLTEYLADVPVLSSIVSTLSGTTFGLTTALIIIMNIPLMIIEGIICAFIVPFIEKVKPDMIEKNRTETET